MRQKLFLLAALALSIAAIFAGMFGEWIREVKQGLPGPAALLALCVLCLSFALGVAFSRRMNAERRAQVDNPIFQASDGRAVLTFIWWPITFLCVAAPLMWLHYTAISTNGPGTGIATGIILVIGVFGFISLPPVVTESVAEYRKRGLRGFWTAARNTEWGDGGAT